MSDATKRTGAGEDFSGSALVKPWLNNNVTTQKGSKIFVCTWYPHCRDSIVAPCHYPKLYII